MKPYKNLSGNSGVCEYEIGLDYIKVQFKKNSPYTYSYASAGRDIVEEMKILAESGKGLNSFINKYAKKLFV